MILACRLFVVVSIVISLNNNNRDSKRLRKDFDFSLNFYDSLKSFSFFLLAYLNRFKVKSKDLMSQIVKYVL